VTGVEAGDVLDVRAEPTTGAAVVGTLAPEAPGAEVVATDPTGNWGELNAGAGPGWAALR
jgi:hypothetical protein